MRIQPSRSRLRLTAFIIWGIALYCLVCGRSVVLPAIPEFVFTVSTQVLGMILFALGIAFWMVGTDHHAGIFIDSKGLLLNLGSSAAFVSWENIERIGITTHRSSLFSVGSSHQFGIVLKDRARYIQSYEERLPASESLFGWTLRRIQSVFRFSAQRSNLSLESQLTRNLRNTGFDVLVPEAFLGGSASAFIELVEAYKNPIIASK